MVREGEYSILIFGVFRAYALVWHLFQSDWSHAVTRVLAALLVSASGASAAQVRGANQSADQGPGARYSALGDAHLGFRGDGTALLHHPASLNDVERLEASVSHASVFDDDAQFTQLSLVIPLAALTTLGAGVGRFGSGGILLCSDPETCVLEDRRLDVADYLVSGAIARRWGPLDAGGVVQLLYRRLDQDGLGVRGDLSLRYVLAGRYMAGLAVRGAIPSSVRWESERLETEPPDVYLGLGAEFPAPYFYGHFRLGWQTEGLLQDGAKSTSSLLGAGAHEDVLDVLRTSHVGFEYALHAGVSLRLGLREVGELSRWTPSFGIGFRHSKWFSLDYGFLSHPFLESSHRFSLSASLPVGGKPLERPRENAVERGHPSPPKSSANPPAAGSSSRLPPSGIQPGNGRDQEGDIPPGEEEEEILE